MFLSVFEDVNLLWGIIGFDVFRKWNRNVEFGDVNMEYLEYLKVCDK